MQIDTFTGGPFETNCFFIEEASVLIDAPMGAAEWLQATGKHPQMLLLTHGHIDHVMDAAEIKKTFGCKVGYHREGISMLTEPGFFKKFGFGWEIAPVEADLFLEPTPSQVLGGIDFQILYVPGHCPGSLCFLDKTEGILFGGDVLFAGGVGRWDLPGGDKDLLLTGIKNKILPLGDSVKVLPGHGPATTVGRERLTNAYLQ